MKLDIKFKNEVVKEFLLLLKNNLETLVKSASSALDAATSTESKAENKYDTRGLEASYLAGAQSKRAAELVENIHRIENVQLDNIPSQYINHFNLVALTRNAIENTYFLILPFQGGMKIQIDSIEIVTITLSSPLGQLLNRKTVGDFFEFKQGGEMVEFEVIQIV